MTPNIAIVDIETAHWRSIPLWIPIFLLWIPAILLSPLIFLVILGLCSAGRISPLRSFRVVRDLLCALPGTHVRVTAADAKVRVQIL